MIEPTDEMVQAFERDGTGGYGDIVDTRLGLAAVLAIAERQWQEQYGDAYQRGWWHGQHRLCPRCGVELKREVAEELAERAKPAAVVHLLTAGDDHVYCCGRPLAEVDGAHELTTLDPHAVICRGPS